VTEHFLNGFECHTVFERHGGRERVARNVHNFSKSK
jgi:hypothetical protein